MTEVIDRIQMARPRRFRRYPAYKDSGVEWLGEIPVHWEVKRLKFLLQEALQYGANEPAELMDPDLPRYIRITDVGEDGRLREETFRSIPKDVARPYLLQDGDLLFARSGATVGKTFRFEPSWGRAAYAGYLIRARLKLQRWSSRFVQYFTKSTSYWDWLQTNFIQATIQNVSAERYANLGIALPELREQQEIVSLLDLETARIDGLVAKKERLIELLQEKRTALITRAVTRGLDPNVPMKDSGVEWLGEIPAHWEVKQLNHLLKARKGAIKTGPFGSQLQSSEMQAGEIKVYNQRSVLDRDFSSGDNYVSLEKFAELSAFEVYPGDLLITTRGSIGRCSILPKEAERGVLHPCLMRVQPDERWILTRFLEIQIEECSIALDQLRFMSNATTIDVIYSDSLREVWLSVPPVEEQTATIAFVAREKARVDGLIAKIRQAIDHLKEFRSALISAAVTGKIDVREEAS